MTVARQTAGLLLPVASRAADEALVRFDPPRHGPPAPATRLAESRMARRVSFDLIAGTATVVTEGLGGLFGEGVVRWDEIGTEVAHDLTRTLTIGTDPLSAETRIVQRYAMGREGWRIRIETETAMTGDAEHFTMTGELRAYENEELGARASVERADPATATCCDALRQRPSDAARMRAPLMRKHDGGASLPCYKRVRTSGESATMRSKLRLAWRCRPGGRRPPDDDSGLGRLAVHAMGHVAGGGSVRIERDGSGEPGPQARRRRPHGRS